MKKHETINSDFPFQSRYLEVKGSKMHYIDEGAGDPILFLHGNPTSSYLWRNIIPYLSGMGRCIAPDLIGMGKSDRPELKYGFFNAYDYIEAFVEQLGLDRITLVVHDWGSAIGFHYGRLHPERLKGLAFMESIYRPPQWHRLPFSTRLAFRLMRTKFFGYLMVNRANIFVRKLLPKMIMRPLSAEEQKAYAQPYPTIKSRDVLRAWPRDLPMNGSPADVEAAVRSYHHWLTTSAVPKLFLHVTPGMANRKEDAEWIRSNVNQVQVVHVGEGLHFIQEDQPHEIGRALAQWYAELDD